VQGHSGDKGGGAVKTPVDIHGKMKREEKYKFGFSSGMMAFISWGWASTILKEMGRKPSEQFGILLAIALGFLVLLLLFDNLLWRWYFGSAIRNGLWAAAALGPYAGSVVWIAFEHPAWGHITGLFATMLLFVTFFYISITPWRG